MNQKISLILAVMLLVLFGCEGQDAAPGVSYVPIDQIDIEDDLVSIEEDLEDAVEEPIEEEAEEAMEEEEVMEEETEGAMEEEVIKEDAIEEVMEEEAEEVMEEEAEEVEDAIEEVEEIFEEEIIEEEFSQEIVIIVQETDLVNLQPVAYDPDQDSLDYSYTTPLGGDGTWQTNYGDQGEYTVTITVSDGELSASKDALLIVNKREEPPVIELRLPEDTEQNIDETMEIEFRIEASDINQDPLTFEWKLDGDLVSTGDTYMYVSDYDSSGSHTIKVDVSDGATTASVIWAVGVSNIDRPPVLKVIPDFTVREGESVVIIPEASDPDDDALEFDISDPVGDVGIWETSYDDSGVYEVTVSVSDGELDDSQEVRVTVINVNRPPVIENIVQVE